MVGSIEHYLTEFHLNPAQDLAPLARPQPPVRETEREIVDVAALIRAAEERGREEGKADAQRGFDSALAAERSSLEERIVQERAKWTEDVATELTRRLDDAYQSLNTKLTDSVARILTLFLADAIRDRAVSELADRLEGLFSGRQAVTVRITGPEDLLSRLSRCLGRHSAVIEYVVNDQAEVRVAMNDTLIETQLSAWTSHLAQAVRSS